jgi:hypothetical protein
MPFPLASPLLILLNVTEAKIIARTLSTAASHENSKGIKATGIARIPKTMLSKAIESLAAAVPVPSER